MVEEGEGTIIFTGATASLRGGAKFGRLAIPKFAVRGLAQCIAREFQPKVRTTLLATKLAMSVGSSSQVCNTGVCILDVSAIIDIIRMLDVQGIHTSHVIIDGQVALQRTMEKYPDRPVDSYLDPDAVAEEYWRLHTQHKTCWTQELDLRPYVEKF